MGIYDRDYYRSGRPSFTLSVPRSAVVTLILINAAVYVAENLVPSLLGTLGVYVGTLTHPLYWWQFLTYGFTHALEPQHVLFNMLGLWFLGRDVEALYGPREFTRLYLAMVIVGGVAWAAANRLAGHMVGGPIVRGLRRVTGIVVLYALHFPRRMMLFMFVIPMPAWVLGLLVVLNDIWGATQGDTRQYGLWGARGGRGLRLPLFSAGLELRPPRCRKPLRLARLVPSPSCRSIILCPTMTTSATRKSTASWRRSIARAKGVSAARSAASSRTPAASTSGGGKDHKSGQWSVVSGQCEQTRLTLRRCPGEPAYPGRASDKRFGRRVLWLRHPVCAPTTERL